MIASPKVLDLLNTIDILVFILILLGTIGFVIYGHTLKKKKSSNEESILDLMLMGRQLTLPIFVMTLVATWYGGIFGVAEIAFNNGIFNFVSQGVFWYITYIIFALFLIDKIKAYNAVTLPDLIQQMFGTKSEKVSAIYNILNLVPVVYTISLGLIIQMLTGLELNLAIIIGVCFVCLYSIFGGMRAVVFSDIFQFFVMVLSVILVAFFSIESFGFAPLFDLPPSYFNPMGTFSFGEVFAWGLIALSTLVDPNFYQRSFAAKDFTTAKKGIFISTMIWIVFDLCLTVGAMYAKALIPEAPSEHGYFYYALQLLPHGLRGFFLAGICATILSTLDSYIFLAGTTLSFDLVAKKYKNKLSLHYLGIITVAILAIILGLSFDGNIKAVWKTLGSISSSALLVPVIYGYLRPNSLSDNGFILTSSLGAIGTIYWRLSGMKYTYNLDEIYIGMGLSLIGILISKLIKLK